MKNKTAKKALINIYGEYCMFERARIAERIEAMGGIRTYKSYVAEKRFKGKMIKKQLTYHHLRHKSERWRSYNRKWSGSRGYCSCVYA